jgi:hypothetical protein
MKRVLLILLLGISPLSYCQESETSAEIPKIGFGFNINPLNLFDSYSLDYSPSKLLITYTPIKFLRIEPEIGYMSWKDDNSKESFLDFGGGLFFMGQRSKINFYGGPKVEYAINKRTYEIWSGETETDKDGRLTIAPTLGAEYFLGKHFSIGGQFALKFISYKDLDGGQNPDEKSTTTAASLQLRFYL